ncbi:unnamed protein product [Dicrocoelium dendriticum]|nr:unnamed protein product [Dicrocoelium dendriticum]
MDKFRRFVLQHRLVRPQSGSPEFHQQRSTNAAHPDAQETQQQHELDAIAEDFNASTFPLSLYEQLSANCSFLKDPQTIREILSTVEEAYYSMTFDSGKHEIEHSAGPTCRNLNQLKHRLLCLDKQNKAVCRRVSELVLEKHPLYESELNSVLLLQNDNLETLELCRRIRRSLKSSANILVLSRLSVLRNFRRRLRLLKVLQVMRQMRTLQNNAHQLDRLLTQGNFHSAIELHRESLVVLEGYRQYRCMEPIHTKLKAFGPRIDDLLDSDLQNSCEHFTESAYATVQQAFELLGSTQTTFAQLQMHYVSAIHRRSRSIVQSYSTLGEEDTDHSEATASTYQELCSHLSAHSLPDCLSSVCQSMWLILLCYHRTTQWHRQRACGQMVCHMDNSPTPCELRSVFVDASNEPTSLSLLSQLEDQTQTADTGVNVDDEDGVYQPQLVRQWHDYVASKLAAGRGRIWAEVSSRIEPILKTMDRSAVSMSFGEVSSVLQTIDRLMKIGEEFSGFTRSELSELLRSSIHTFFKDFHRKHLERLRMFLENETWEMCPVKFTFTVLDLQEFQPLSSLLKKSEKFSPRDRRRLTPDSSEVHNGKVSSDNFFIPPYKRWQFCAHDRAHSSRASSDVETTSTPVPDSTESESSNSLDSGLGSHSFTTSSSQHCGPLLSSTTLEALRLIGRYMQMMHLLKPIASEVMHCLCQVFDYYLYSLVDSAELPERLRSTLKRIRERLIASNDHPSVIKGDRFALPAHEPMRVFQSVSRFWETVSDPTSSGTPPLWQMYLQAHFVGVESVNCLAEMLEQTLLPHLSNLLPERKRGLTSVFREQSLMAARQLREPCAAHIAPQLLSLLVPSGPPVSPGTPQSVNASTTIASSLSKIWPIGSNNVSSSSIDKESNKLGGSSPIPNAKMDPDFDSNVFASHVASVQWTTNEVATRPSPYVNQLRVSVLGPFNTALHTLTRRLGISDTCRSVMWSALLNCIGSSLLNAFAEIHLCSEEGRGQMLLDVQSIAVFAEADSKMQSFPRLDHVIEYIQAFYIPAHEWEHWLAHTGTKYSRAQLTGLAHCLARGDRRQRQRLLNSITQIHGSGGTQTVQTNGTNTTPI